jgi:RNA polymerase sigma-70 factor, ECF subfamily
VGTRAERVRREIGLWGWRQSACIHHIAAPATNGNLIRLVLFFVIVLVLAGSKERERLKSGGLLGLRISGCEIPVEINCNLSPSSGVVHSNDDPPVHTTEAGVSPASDFTTFMRNYQDMVFSTAARLTGNDAQAQDIAQDVFLKAYENYDHLSTSVTAGGWLKTVATNLSLNYLSRYRKRWRFFSEFARDADSGDERDAPDVEFSAPDTFFADIDAEDRRESVERALSALPPHQRVPLVLYHFEELPYEDIARKLNVSLAKVKTDILRARVALAKILLRSGTRDGSMNR